MKRKGDKGSVYLAEGAAQARALAGKDLGRGARGLSGGSKRKCRTG